MTSRGPGLWKEPAVIGMPAGHLPVRSYTRTGEPRRGNVIGGLFFGHRASRCLRMSTSDSPWGWRHGRPVARERAVFSLMRKRRTECRTNSWRSSHTSCAPLNAIVGYSRCCFGMLRRTEGGTRSSYVERNAKWLRQIVDDVLDVSRIVSGKIRLDVQRVELPVLIENAVATVSLPPTRKACECTRCRSSSRPCLWRSRTSPAGRLEFDVECRQVHPEAGVSRSASRVNSHVEIAVSDTGSGSGRILPMCLSVSARLNRGLPEIPGGLGLGLAIVSHIVEMHGGVSRSLSSGEGLGASFTVRLHSDRATGRVPTLQHPRTDLHPPSFSWVTSGHRVLAVDDGVAGALARRARKRRCRGHHDRIRVQALEELPSARPDVCVSVFGMPEMDGYEFIKRVRDSGGPDGT